MTNEKTLHSRKINQQPVDVKKNIKEEYLLKNAFYEWFRAIPNFNVSTVAHCNRTAASLFNETNPQFNTNFQGNKTFFAQNASIKRPINPSDDGALKKAKTLHN